MSKPASVEELATQINRLLEKHEVHNEVLAIELSILILKREKTTLKWGHNKAIEAISKATGKL